MTPLPAPAESSSVERNAPDWSLPTDTLLEQWLGRSLPGRVDGSGGPAAPTVVHVAAVAPVDGGLYVLRIDEHTPRSSIDSYLLNATRAWADVVLTSGQIVRDEPDLSFAPGGPNSRALRALSSARESRTASPVRIGVLSSGSGLDETLPVWGRGGEFTLITDRDGARRSDAWVQEAGVDVAVLDPVGPRTAVEWALGVASKGTGVGRVSVELGARSSVELYPVRASRAGCLVDVLVLSEYRGSLPEGVLGERFLPGVELEELFVPGPQTCHDQWCFRCWRRSGAAG